MSYLLFFNRTQLDRSDTEPSPLPTTVEPWASSSCTTSPMKTLLLQYRTGEATKHASDAALKSFHNMI